MKDIANNYDLVRKVLLQGGIGDLGKVYFSEIVGIEGKMTVD